jgi:hypothetical protein
MNLRILLSHCTRHAIICISLLEAINVNKSIYLLISLLMIAVIISAIGCAGREASLVTPTPQESADAILNQIETQVSGLRGLSPQKDIEPQFVSAQELKSLLDKEFTENNSAEELRMEQEELTILDLLPPDYDLADSLLKLSEEQVIGFYDYRTSQMVVLGNLSQIDAEEKIAFAHEYDHALEDQTFNLQSLPLHDKNNSDFALAAQSVAEGDATLAMMLYAYRYLGPNVITDLAQGPAGNSTALDAAPSVIRETLLFPYLQGVQFVTSIFLQGGWNAVNQLYSDLPKSTEQILHPQKYLAHEQPKDVTIPDLSGALGEGWVELDSNVLGELYIMIYLGAFVDSATATKAAQGWGGDRYVFYQDAGKRGLMVLRSTWDTPQDAQEFFDAYLLFIQNKGKQSWPVFLNTQEEKWWNAPGQSVYLSKHGSDVLIILAPDEKTLTSILPQFASP